MILLSSALAAPPEGVVPDDVDRWVAGAQRLLDGPTGCWELTGRVELVLAGYVPASRWTASGRRDHRFAGPFRGRLEDGRWTAFEYQAEGDDEVDLEVPILPMVGKIDPAVVRRIDLPEDEDDDEDTLSVDLGSGETVDTLRDLLDALEPETATSYAEWSDALGAIRLLEDYPLSARGREVVTVTTLFPGGGPPTALDAVFPRRVKVGDGIVKATLFDAQLHLRGQVVGDETLPALESLSAGIGALGFTLGYEQKLVYERATRCAP